MYSTLDLQKLVQMLAYLGLGGGPFPVHGVVLGGGNIATPGAAGTALVSNGPGADPSFQAINYTIAGTGAVSRTVTAGLQDHPTIRDFNAAANGTTDDAAAIIAAVSAYNSPFASNGGYAIKTAVSLGSSQTIVAEPGADFIYSGAGTIVLGGGANYISYKEGADHDSWYWGRNRTGTHSTGGNVTGLGYGGSAFHFDVHGDDMNVGGDFSRGVYSRHIFGGSGKQGGVFAILGEAYHQNAATNASNPQRNYVATGGNMHIQSSDGGTGTTFATAKGAYFGMATAVYADAAATNILGVVGQEIDLFGAVGASAAYTTALNLVNFSQVTGAQLDGALTIGSGADPTYGNGLGWTMGICFSDLNGRDPIRTNGTLIGYNWCKTGGQRSVNEGINLTGFTIAGSLLQGQYSRWGETSTVISFGGKGTQVINLLGSTTTTTAPAAGGAGALPATPRGYYNVQINGNAVQIPFY